jgi:hypothetical protein
MISRRKVSSKDSLELFIVFGIIRDYVKTKGLPINFTLAPNYFLFGRHLSGGWEREMQSIEAGKNLTVFLRRLQHIVRLFYEAHCICNLR